MEEDEVMHVLDVQHQLTQSEMSLAQTGVESRSMLLSERELLDAQRSTKMIGFLLYEPLLLDMWDK
jgi:hypothetical protein